MIKKLALVLVSVLGMALFAGCDNSKDYFSDISSMTKEDYADAFNEVVGANLPLNVLTGHDRYKISASYFDENESSVISEDVSYISSAKIYREVSNGEKIFFEKGECFGYDADLKMPYCCFFINDNIYTDKFDNYFDNFVYVSNQYTIKEIKEEDASIVITGVLTYEELCKISGGSVDWMTEGDVYKAVFTVNKESLLAEKCSYYIDSADSSKLIAEINYEYDIDDFEANEDLYKQSHGEGRTSTIVVNPGTKSEDSKIIKVPLKCDIVYCMDDSVEYYYDLEKTNRYTYDMHNTDSDETIYCFTSSDNADETSAQSDTSKGE